MNARVIEKNIQVDDRRFCVRKYTAMDGIKIAKLVLAKILPAFQDFMSLAKDLVGKNKPVTDNDDSESTESTESTNISVSEIIDNLSLDTIAAALDKISGDDLDYIIKKSLQSVEECLPAGNAPIMYSNGTFGVENVEYDPVLVLRLTCEAVMWGCGSFFDENRLTSVMKPLFNGEQQNR